MNNKMHNGKGKQLQFVSVLLILASGCCLANESISQGAYVIVVNEANSYEPTDMDEVRQVVSRLLLKQDTTWPNGVRSFPLFRPSKSAAQQATTSGVMEMTEAAMDRYWLKAKQQTGDTPPNDVTNDKVLLKIIKRYEGGVGVVSAQVAADLPEGIRELIRFDP